MEEWEWVGEGANPWSSGLTPPRLEEYLLRCVSLRVVSYLYASMYFVLYGQHVAQEVEWVG